MTKIAEFYNAWSHAPSIVRYTEKEKDQSSSGLLTHERRLLRRALPMARPSPLQWRRWGSSTGLAWWKLVISFRVLSLTEFSSCVAIITQHVLDGKIDLLVRRCCGGTLKTEKTLVPSCLFTSTTVVLSYFLFFLISYFAHYMRVLKFKVLLMRTVSKGVYEGCEFWHVW